jgi:hypothetical protein
MKFCPFRASIVADSMHLDLRYAVLELLLEELCYDGGGRGVD